MFLELHNCAIPETSISTPWKVINLEIPEGWGILKAKLLGGEYEAKLGWGERGCKTFCGGECGYFLELHIFSLECIQLQCTQVKLLINKYCT